MHPHAPAVGAHFVCDMSYGGAFGKASRRRRALRPEPWITYATFSASHSLQRQFHPSHPALSPMIGCPGQTGQQRPLDEKSDLQQESLDAGCRYPKLQPSSWPIWQHPSRAQSDSGRTSFLLSFATCCKSKQQVGFVSSQLFNEVPDLHNIRWLCKHALHTKACCPLSQSRSVYEGTC